MSEETYVSGILLSKELQARYFAYFDLLDPKQERMLIASHYRMELDEDLEIPSNCLAVLETEISHYFRFCHVDNCHDGPLPLNNMTAYINAIKESSFCDKELRKLSFSLDDRIFHQFFDCLNNMCDDPKDLRKAIAFIIRIYGNYQFEFLNKIVESYVDKAFRKFWNPKMGTPSSFLTKLFPEFEIVLDALRKNNYFSEEITTIVGEQDEIVLRLFTCYLEMREPNLIHEFTLMIGHCFKLPSSLSTSDLQWFETTGLKIAKCTRYLSNKFVDEIRRIASTEYCYRNYFWHLYFANRVYRKLIVPIVNLGFPSEDDVFSRIDNTAFLKLVNFIFGFHKDKMEEEFSSNESRYCLTGVNSMHIPDSDLGMAISFNVTEEHLRVLLNRLEYALSADNNDEIDISVAFLNNLLVSGMLLERRGDVLVLRTRLRFKEFQIRTRRAAVIFKKVKEDCFDSD